ncbi:hypothetical protein HRG_006227 [Hirsutella rhossiliensis]|uniref:Uncharacterized protein n=1 Tax=Hirsutella rhossiliensis TaxID=111463 RepID=A0A9P8N2W7_9HYPO|nr:uncharacterized protein HRG_06227 [Hirsutella rhossiliensis]KAH0963717.1 hypothetical protein HRG_06227 [Hirsutella rhossiliensis]
MSSNIPDFEAVLVPMQLDVFVLNPSVCGTGAEDDDTSDVQNHADLHNTAPASVYSRLTDLGGRPEPQPLRHRHGVYIHWTLPRCYRAGVSSGESVPERRRRQELLRRGLGVPGARDGGGAASNETPEFVDPPTRWIVIHREYEAWVVESDYLWSLEDIPVDADLQTNVALFVVGHAGSDVNIEEQAEVFIGCKTPLADWSGEEGPSAQPPSISLLRSGNQLFADFQMHNANVFSVLDNFEYGSSKKPQYLTQAKASYYVLGWHWKEDTDPLWKSGQSVAHGASLDALFMTLHGVSETAPNRDPWLDAMSQLRILCHGAMYNVIWDHENKPKDVPADAFNARLRDQTKAAVSVGTTPMDALLSYCHARRDQSGGIDKLEEDILALGSLLQARDDGVESQREAKDTPLEPKKPAVLKQRELNQTQTLLDACSMAARQYRWDMFSLWWNANDPTVLIGGITSGWPTDYLNKVAVRAPFQTLAPKDGASSNLPGLFKSLSSLLENQLPDVFKAPAVALVTEFYVIRPGGDDSGSPAEGIFYPQFHDKLTTDERWRDLWGNLQPWFPLYAESEVEYQHVPFDYWKLDEHTARLSANEGARYSITVPSADNQKPPPLWEALSGKRDLRVLSGRVLILPQPSFSLAAKIKQLFQNTPPDILNKYLSAEDRANLLKNVGQLSYLSSPLSGLASGLATRAQGSHIKPENKIVGPTGESSTAIATAVIDAAGLTAENIKLIQGNSALTPFATLANFLKDGFCPFKPMTHEQFRFRKLNIIDKFGQSLMAIDQSPRPQGPPPMYPCISDFYEPQTIKLDDGKVYANTIYQKGRLNAEFVKRIAEDPDEDKHRPQKSSSPEGDSAKWRPVTEWETPIWGWLITNYADYGIQLFLPNGTFYREVRFGGPLGTLSSPTWLPFSPDQDAQPNPDTRQLDALVAKLADPEYLRGFWYMATTAEEKLPAAPSAYAQFVNSIVGKPLALHNTGWSLELDGPPLEIQSTRSEVMSPECQLTQPSDPSDQTPFYQFQVRLGDRDAAYDGLVGYFDTTAPGTDEINIDLILTFFAPEKDDMKPLRRLNTKECPLFALFWEAPFPTEPPYNDSSRIVDAARFDDRCNSRRSIFGAILDPCTPVHAYSSFLPPVVLSLPPWTWLKAMDTMTAFFHAGPLTMPLNDVPGYDAAQHSAR